MAGLVVQHIVKSFQETRVLSDISFEALDGEFVVLLGPSGCGKSTLLRIIAGLDTQDQGSILIGNTVVDALQPRDRDIAMVFQHYALYPHLTVKENMAFGLKMRKESAAVIEQRIADTASLLEIQDLLNRKPKELSGGQRQRVAMGRAIVRKPALFLFDEPLSNLDARLRVAMRLELKKLHQRLGATILYVTHDQIEALTLGQKIVVMNRGVIQQIGTPDEIYHRPLNPFVAGFIGSPPMNLIQGTVDFHHQRLHFHAGSFSVTLETRAPVTSSLHSDVAVLGIRPEHIRLDAPQEPYFKVEGQIDVIENLGDAHIVYLFAQDQHIIMKRGPDSTLRPGDTIEIFLPFSTLHLFVNDVRIPLELYSSISSPTEDVT